MNSITTRPTYRVTTGGLSVWVHLSGWLEFVTDEDDPKGGIYVSQPDFDVLHEYIHKTEFPEVEPTIFEYDLNEDTRVVWADKGSHIYQQQDGYEQSIHVRTSTLKSVCWLVHQTLKNSAD